MAHIQRLRASHMDLTQDPFLKHCIDRKTQLYAMLNQPQYTYSPFAVIPVPYYMPIQV